MKSKEEKDKIIKETNALLTELYDSVSNAAAKDAVQRAYNRINRQLKISTSYKEIPESIDILKKDFSRLSLSKKTRFTRSQEEIVYKLTQLSRKSFQRGFDGLAYASIWFS
ncbi:hypothetical protein AALT52_01555 [Ligilactobacillus faecis]|uniref:Bacteriocin immunity protein n=1 Tax=Ligilactobacillus faecis TaxID=762833 RepID=A0ABV4DM78_9LACO